MAGIVITTFSYLAVAGLAASFGFLLCGIMSSARLLDLSRRLDQAKQELLEKASIIQGLTADLRISRAEAGRSQAAVADEPPLEEPHIL